MPNLYFYNDNVWNSDIEADTEIDMLLDFVSSEHITHSPKGWDALTSFRYLWGTPVSEPLLA